MKSRKIRSLQQIKQKIYTERNSARFYISIELRINRYKFKKKTSFNAYMGALFVLLRSIDQTKQKVGRFSEKACKSYNCACGGFGFA